jgi:hypothetical protein
VVVSFGDQQVVLVKGSRKGGTATHKV